MCGKMWEYAGMGRNIANCVAKVCNVEICAETLLKSGYRHKEITN